jgi:hypothetical protein
MDVKQGEFRSSILTTRRLHRRALGKQVINNKNPLAVGQQGDRGRQGRRLFRSVRYRGLLKD